MDQGADWPVSIIATQDVACGVRLWRTGGRRRATVIVKATFLMQKGGVMQLVAPAGILVGDRTHDGLPHASVAQASDVAPYLPRGEVLFVGHAYAPTPSPELSVRLSVVGQRPLIEKTVHVYGERMWLDSGEATAPVPFTRLPLRYERSARGVAGYEENPLGMARAPGLAVANVVDPSDPEAPAGFGPIPGGWPARVRLLRGQDPAAVEAPEPALPDTFAWSFFHTAPPDQRCTFFEGDEWVILENLHADHARFESKLPSARAEARIYGLDATGHRNVPLVADTLWIDGDRGVVCLTWRGNVEIADDASLAAVQVFAGLELPGRPIPWPDQNEDDPRTRAVSPSAYPVPGGPTAFDGTAVHEAGQPHYGPMSLSPATVPRGHGSAPPPQPGSAPPPAYAQHGSAPPGPFTPGGSSPPTRAHGSAPPPTMSPATLPHYAPAGVAHGLDAQQYPSPSQPLTPLPLTPQPTPGPMPAPSSPHYAPAYEGHDVAPRTRASTIEMDRRGGTLASADVAARVRAVVEQMEGGGLPPSSRQMVSAPGEVSIAEAPLEPLEPFDGGSGRDSVTAIRVDPRWLADGEGSITQDAVSSSMPLVQPALSTTVPTPSSHLERLIHRASTPASEPHDFDDPPTMQPDATELAELLRAAEQQAPPSDPKPGRAVPLAPPPPRPLDVRPTKTTIRGLQPQREPVTTRQPTGEMTAVAPAPAPAPLPKRPRPLLDLEPLEGPTSHAQLDPPTRQLEVPDDLRQISAETTVASVPPELIEALLARDAEIARVDREAEAAARPVSFAVPSTVDSPAPAADAADDDEESPPTAAFLGRPPVITVGDMREEVERRIREGEPLDGLDLSDTDMTGFDLSGRKLVGARMDRAKLMGVGLRGTDLSGASLEGADLSNAELDDASLERTNLVGANLSNARLRRTFLTDANMTGANLTDASFEQASGQRVIMGRARADRARFTGASLDGLDLAEAQLDGAVLDGALLPELRCYEASAEGASFARCSLAGARFDGAVLSRARFDGISADDSLWDRAMLDGASFEGARLTGASFTKASLRGANLSGAVLDEARFNRATLTGARVVGVDLSTATLDGADLNGLVTEG